MDLISLAILFMMGTAIIVVGVLLRAANTYLPMDAKIKQILNIVVVVALVIFILSLFWGYMPHIRVGK